MKKNTGQSLVEMVVAIAVVLLVILALVAVTTVSVRNASFSRNQALATKYAQEAVEKVRAYRDQNSWSDFTSNCETFSLNLSMPSSFTLSRDCYQPGISNNCSNAGDICEVKITISWTDAKGTHKSELTTRLAKWK